MVAARQPRRTYAMAVSGSVPQPEIKVLIVVLMSMPDTRPATTPATTRDSSTLTRRKHSTNRTMTAMTTGFVRIIRYNLLFHTHSFQVDASGNRSSSPVSDLIGAGGAPRAKKDLERCIMWERHPQGTPSGAFHPGLPLSTELANPCVYIILDILGKFNKLHIKIPQILL